MDRIIKDQGYDDYKSKGCKIKMIEQWTSKNKVIMMVLQGLYLISILIPKTIITIIKWSIGQSSIYFLFICLFYV